MQKERYTLVADFAVQGDLAYLSHQETLTLFQRAFIRAAVPLMYSSGFNPHPHVSIPFPRSVGTCSDGDRVTATVEFETVPANEQLSERVQQQLPTDCRLLGLHCVPGKQTFLPASVRYQFMLNDVLTPTQQAHLGMCKGQIDHDEAIHIQRYRAKKKRYQTFDISPFVQSLDIQSDCIEVVCSVTQGGTVRVDELMQWLAIDINRLREPVKRTDIVWDQNKTTFND